MKPIIDMKRCFGSKDICMAIKLCPVHAIRYMEAAEPILDKTLKCNCNDREARGQTAMSAEGYNAGCDCTGGCENDGGLYDCGGNPYGRIVINSIKCVGCGVCAKECCGDAIKMESAQEAANTFHVQADNPSRKRIAAGKEKCCCGGKC